MLRYRKRLLSLLLAFVLLSGVFPSGTAVHAENQDAQPLELPALSLPESAETPTEWEITTEPEIPAEPEITVPPEAPAEPEPPAEEQLELLSDGVLASGTCGANLTWQLTEEGVFTVTGSGAMEEYVYEYDRPWHDYRGQVKELVLPHGLTVISEHAFSGFTQVTDLDIPETVTHVGEAAFYGVGITELYIPDSVTQLGIDAFRACSKLKNVYIGNGVSDIPHGCFATHGYVQNSSLEYVTLGISVENIDGDAFYCLSSLKRFTVLANNPYFSNDRLGILYNKDQTQLVFFPGNCLPEGQISYTIPSQVTHISYCAFQNDSRIRHLTIPKTVQEVGDDAFRGASLQTLRLEGGALIGDSAFSQNLCLTGVYVGSRVRELESDVFSGCTRLSQVIFEEGLQEIGWGTFRDCTSLKRITLPDSLEVLSKDTFDGCTALHTVNLPKHLTEIGERAFYECYSLANVTMPDTVEAIGEEAFAYCSALQHIRISPVLRRLEYGAFYGCTLLRHVEMPETLNYMGGQIFGCSGLKTILFLGPEPDHPSGAGFFSDPNYSHANITIFYLPEPENYDGYYGWNTPKWSSYACYPLLTAGSITTSTQDYYKDLSPRYFNFVSQGSPVLAASLTVGETTVTAPSGSDSLTVAIDTAAVESVSVSRSGMIPVTLPGELLSSFNTVELYPETTRQPFVQAAYGRLESKNARKWNNLYYGGMVLTSGSEEEELELYLDVNWNGYEAGRILLSQYTDASYAWELSPTGGFYAAAPYSAGLQAGKPLYVIVETADGQQFARKLQVEIYQPRISMELETIPDIDAGLPEGDAAQPFMEMEMKLQLPKDFDFTLKVMPDGTIRGTLGCTRTSTSTESEDLLYDSIKDTLKSAEPGQDTYSLVEYMVNQMGGEVNRPRTGKMMVEADVRYLGYLEGRYVRQNDGTVAPVFTEGAIAVSLEGAFSFVYQITIPSPAPMPFYIKSSLEPEFETVFPFFTRTENGMLEAGEIRMTVELPLRISGGLGWESILSLGIYGEGQIVLEGVLTRRNDTNGYLEASFGAEAAVFGFSTDLTIAKTDPWYFIGGPEATLLGYESIMQELQQAEWKPQSRDYLDAPPLEELQLFDVSEENTTLSSGAVTTSAVYPYADVQVATTEEGRQLAVWVADNGKQPAANRSVLYYSLYNPKTNSWTTPKIVDKDGTADFDPLLKRIGSKLYLIWKNAQQPLTDADSMEDIAGLLDLKCVSISTYSGVSLGKAVVFGTDAYDSCVDLTETADGVAAVWVSNTVNSVFGGAENACTIYRQTLNGQPEVLAEHLFYVEGLTADGDLVWFTADIDGDNATISDRELFCLAGGQLSQVTDDAVADTSPTLIGKDLTWYKDGVLHVEEQSVPAVANDRSCFVASDAMQAILYVTDSPLRKSTLYASFNDGSGWGKPMELTGITGNIGSLDADFLADGTLSIAVCERVLDAQSDNYLADAAYLRHYTMTVGGDLVITNAEYIGQTMVPGGELTVLMDIFNAGASQAQLIRLSAGCDTADGEPVVMLAQLPSGESTTLSINLPLPEDLRTTGEITVTAEIVGQQEITPEDNTRTLHLRLQDLAVEGAKAISDGNTTTVTAMVTNRGQQSLSGITVQLFAGEELLAVQTAAQLNSQDGTFITLQVDSGMENLTLLTLQADAAGLERAQENLSANNTLTIPVEGVIEAQFAVTGTAAATAGGASAQVAIINTIDDGRMLSLCAAAYHMDGKLLDVQYQRCDGSSQQVTMALTGGDQVKTVRIFVLDGDNKPIQLPAEIPVR